MNAERLHVIVKALKKEMDGKNLVGLMQNLVSGLRALGQNSNANTQQNVSSHRTVMHQALADSEVDRFSPTWKQVVAEIGGDDLFGAALNKTIEATIGRNQMTPAVAADELEPVRARMEKFSSALAQATSSFSALKIGDEKLAPGECEVGMLIPRSAVGNRLFELTAELRELGIILNTFSEVATGKADELPIETISSSDFLIYILASAPFAACLASAVGAVLGHYKTLLEIRKLQLEIAKLGVPNESAKGIEEYANQHMERGIEKVTVEIMNQFYTGNDGGRKNELTNAVRISLNKIANRIDNGYNIEVRCEPLGAATPEESKGQRAAIAAVQAASKNMQFLKLDGKPILRLPEKAEGGTKGSKSEHKRQNAKKHKVTSEHPQPSVSHEKS